MKIWFIILSLFCITLNTFSQSNTVEVKGNVSFISSQFVYVKFVNTEGIQTGDTLFILKNNILKPALVVKSFSSISCACTPIKGNVLSVTNELMARKRIEMPLEVVVEKSTEPVAVNDLAIKNKPKESSTENKARFDGRLSISSYSNFSENPLSTNTPNYRLRYNLALNAEHIGNSGLSFENYMSYTHTLNNPAEKYKDLKIYNLALRYDFGKTTSLTVGRKINVNTANVGAVDGLQFEQKFKNITVGALAGTRPNDSTYGFDSKLIQYGAFISHNFLNEHSSTQTSVAFFNQTNNMKTDRRYIYLQHANSLLKNVDFFGSAEVDLYAIENNTPINDFDLTSLYLSLSYRPIKKLSLSLSYDARKNVYYYETYKNKIDSMLEKETWQGLRFRFNYRPFKYFSWGGNAGYRLQTPTSAESMNAISYLTYSKVPWVNASVTVTGTALQTANFSGFIYGASMSKEFGSNFSVEAEYRKAQIFAQDIAELSFSWRLSKKLMLSTDFEGTLEQGNAFGRIFINITQRF
ncbi:MAG: hypothetical protein QM800_13395 [Paludibacter sp.]